jgi:hypothetical protein
MSEVFTKYSSTVSTVAAHHTIMDIAEMGINIVGPLTTAQGNYKYEVEYFTK